MMSSKSCNRALGFRTIEDRAKWDVLSRSLLAECFIYRFAVPLSKEERQAEMIECFKATEPASVPMARTDFLKFVDVQLVGLYGGRALSAGYLAALHPRSDMEKTKELIKQQDSCLNDFMPLYQFLARKALSNPDQAGNINPEGAKRMYFDITVLLMHSWFQAALDAAAEGDLQFAHFRFGQALDLRGRLALSPDKQAAMDKEAQAVREALVLREARAGANLRKH